MEQFFQVTDISSAIQLAVAPVFLLAGITGALNVMTHRLGRIVDRGRFLKDKKAVCDEAERILVHERTQVPDTARHVDELGHIPEHLLCPVDMSGDSCAFYWRCNEF